MTEAEARARLLVARLNVIAAVLTLLYLMWAMTPEHTRRLWLMQVTAAAQTRMSRFARRAGAADMARELRGARPGYELPYLLSCGRDWLAELYDQLRVA